MKPLSNLRVIDFTTNISGPTLTMILADLGAEVIKIEKPAGDEARGMVPIQHGNGVYFNNINRGKKSVVIDLKNENERAQIYKFIEGADIVVENFRQGVASKLAIDYETVKTYNKEIIYCSLSAYGLKGPKKKFPGYDAIVQAETGLMSITGNDQLARIPVSIIDQGSALWGVVGILSALQKRQQTGEGSYVTTSLYETGVFWSNYHLLAAKLLQKNPQKLGTNHGAFAPYGAFKTNDGQIMVGISNDMLFQRFSEALEQQQWLDNEDFQTNTKRVQHRARLNEEIENVTKHYNTQQIVLALEQARVPVAEVKSMLDVLSDEQLLENELLVDLTQQGQSITVTRLPFQISSTNLTPNGPAPLLGEHTAYYLGASENEL